MAQAMKEMADEALKLKLEEFFNLKNEVRDQMRQAKFEEYGHKASRGT